MMDDAAAAAAATWQQRNYVSHFLPILHHYNVFTPWNKTSQTTPNSSQIRCCQSVKASSSLLILPWRHGQDSKQFSVAMETCSPGSMFDHGAVRLSEPSSCDLA